MAVRLRRAAPAGRRALLAAALVAGSPAHGDEPAAADAVPGVEIVGTAFRITTADGRVLAGQDLVGAVLEVGDPAAAGGRLALRIDAVQPDPEDPSGETMLYALAVRDPATGAWLNPCQEDADGVALAFPLAGVWTQAGEHVASSDGAFSLTCTSGASAKCVRMGYRPWKAAADGTPLWDHHQACVRMVRADYCGDGEAHTRDGVRINVYDPLGIQVAEPAPGMDFEAGWGPDGAVCVRRVRVPGAASLEGLSAACPERLAGRIGDACTEEAALRSGGALVLNASAPAAPREER